MPLNDPAPRAIPGRRKTLLAELTPFELSLLIEELESRAVRVAERADWIDVADWMFVRIGQLRELLR
jgi:hypothetical protein